MPRATVTPARADAASRANVAAGTADTALLAADPARVFAAIYNDSTAPLYLAAGTAAATRQSLTVTLAGSAYYEVPPELTTFAWRGIWGAADGTARLTTATR